MAVGGETVVEEGLVVFRVGGDMGDESRGGAESVCGILMTVAVSYCSKVALGAVCVYVCIGGLEETWGEGVFCCLPSPRVWFVDV